MPASQLHGFTQIILVLGMTPTWASNGASGSGRGDICNGTGQTPGQITDDTPYTTSMPKTAAWSTYVSTVAQMFKGEITAYEVWNEPGLGQFWSGTPEQMFQLTSLARQAIRKQDPAAKVLSGSLTPRYSENQFNQNYLKQIASDGWKVDGIAFHSYSTLHSAADGSGADVAAMLNDHNAQVQQVKDYITQLGPKLQPHKAMPLWETEVNHNLPSCNPTPPCPTGCVPPPGQPASPCAAQPITVHLGPQVQLVGRTFIDDLERGVDHEVWYAFNRPFGVSMSATSSAYLTLRTMQSWVTGHFLILCTHGRVSNVRVSRCYLDGREIDWAARSVTVPGLNGRRCTLPAGACDNAKNIKLTPRPQLIIHQ